MCLPCNCFGGPTQEQHREKEQHGQPSPPPGSSSRFSPAHRSRIHPISERNRPQQHGGKAPKTPINKPSLSHRRAIRPVTQPRRKSQMPPRLPFLHGLRIFSSPNVTTYIHIISHTSREVSGVVRILPPPTHTINTSAP